MAEVTVSQFAEVLKVPVDRLLVQLDQAGIKVSGPNDRGRRPRKFAEPGAVAKLQLVIAERQIPLTAGLSRVIQINPKRCLE